MVPGLISNRGDTLLRSGFIEWATATRAPERVGEVEGMDKSHPDLVTDPRLVMIGGRVSLLS